MPKKKRSILYGLGSIEIEKFRNMEGLEIPLGQRITVIAGQNGTGKSTLLGMLGQPFGMDEVQTIFGKSCATKFRDIFKMSPVYDVPGEHLYFINFRDTEISNGKQHVQVKSYPRKSTDASHIRLVTGASRKRGEGNIAFPVIYLGMKRVYPVGEISKPQAMDPDLSNDEVACFVNWYSRIMVPIASSNLDPVKMTKRGQKETLLVNSGDYDYLANSAGQDNLGQILAALISFQRIQKELGSDYKGGLLLIDEVDATLFPASQVGLLDILFDVAPILKIQIVMTTHSTDLVQHSLELAGKYSDDVEVVYLRNQAGHIHAEVNPLMDTVRSDLLIKPLSPNKEFKVELWCEDEEAAWFLRKMMPQRLARKCSVQAAGLSCGELAELAIREKIPAIRNVVFVTDADGVKNSAKKIKECSRLFVLPGNNVSPERSVCDLLNSLPDDDQTWSSFPRGYTKQTFRRLRDEAEDECRREGKKIDRKFEKRWFNKTKKTGLWGTNGSEIYKAWAKVFETDIASFCEALEHRVDAILSRMIYEDSK